MKWIQVLGADEVLSSWPSITSLMLETKIQTTANPWAISKKGRDRVGSTSEFVGLFVVYMGSKCMSKNHWNWKDIGSLVWYRDLMISTRLLSNLYVWKGEEIEVYSWKSFYFSDRSLMINEQKISSEVLSAFLFLVHFKWFSSFYFFFFFGFSKHKSLGFA